MQNEKWKANESRKKQLADNLIGDDVELGVERARENARGALENAMNHPILGAVGGLALGLILGALISRRWTLSEEL